MNRLTKISVFLIPILILVFSLIIATEKETIQQQTYTPQVIINAPWGKKNVHMDKEASPEGEFGIFDPYSRNSKAYDEGPVQGPSNFTVAPNGDIYICDIFNERIQRFSANGQLVSIIDIGGWRGYGDDISVDESGNIYLLYSSYSPVRVCKFDQQGNLLIEYVSFKDEDSKGMNIGGGPTKLYCDNSGRLFITYYKENERAQVIFQLGTATAEFSPAQQKATIRRGNAGISGRILNKDQIFQYIDGKMFTVDDSDEKMTGYNFSGGYSFLDVDGSGNAYMTHYDAKTDIYSVRKQTPDGEVISTFGWKLEGYAQDNLNKPLTVDDEGNVYVLGSTKDGITLTKWSPSGK